MDLKYNKRYILGILIIGILLLKENAIAALFIVFVSIMMLIKCIFKFTEIYKEKKQRNT